MMIFFKYILFLVLISSYIFSKDLNDPRILNIINGSQHNDSISDLIYLTQKKILITSSYDKTVKIWDPQNSELIDQFLGNIGKGYYGGTYTIATNSDHSLFATGGFYSEDNEKNLNHRGAVRLYDLNTYSLMYTFLDHTDSVMRIKFSKDNKYLISASYDNSINIWDLKSLKLKHKFYYDDDIYDFDILEDDSIVSVYGNGKVVKYSLTSQKIIKEIVLPISATCIKTNSKSVLIGNCFDSSYELYVLNKDLQIQQELALYYDSEGVYLKDLQIAINDKRKTYQENYNNFLKYGHMAKQKYNKILNIHNLELTNNNKMIVSANLVYGKRFKSKKIINVKKHLLSLVDLDHITQKFPYIEFDDMVYKAIESPDEFIVNVGKNLYFIDKALKNITNSILGSNEYIQKINIDNDHLYFLKNDDSYSLDLKNLGINKTEYLIQNIKTENSNIKLADYIIDPSTNMEIAKDGYLFILDKTKLYDAYINPPDKFIKKRSDEGDLHSSFGFHLNMIVSGGLAGKLYVYDLNGIKKIELKGHSSTITNIHSFEDKLVSVSDRNIIKVWKFDNSINSNQGIQDIYPLISIYISEDNEYVMWTEEGYFTVSSPKALKYITWHMNQGYDKEAIRYDIGKFYDVFFRPDLVKLKLQGKDISKYTNGLTAKDALKNPPPEVKITNVDDEQIKHKNDLTYIATTSTKKDSVKVKFNVSDFGGGIGTIRIYHEGKLIKTIGKNQIDKVIANIDSKLEEKNKEAQLKDFQKLALSKAINGKFLELNEQIADVTEDTTIFNSSGDYEIDVSLKKGINQISIEAFNKTNTISSFRSSVNINADIQKKKSKLYAITLGVNNFESSYSNSLQNLKYAVNDAKAISNLALKSKDKIFDDVEIINLSNEEVTKDNIQKAFNKVVAKASIEDTIVFYISTHGISANGKFYLLPSNNSKISNLIEFSEIFNKSSDIKSLNQIFIIDACQSGKANDIASSVYDSRASVLARSSGIHLLSASTSDTNAFENDKVKHSNFTYQIIQAMNNINTDKNNDKMISVVEISDVLKNMKLQDAKQFPVIQNVGSDINISKVE